MCFLLLSHFVPSGLPWRCWWDRLERGDPGWVEGGDLLSSAVSWGPWGHSSPQGDGRGEERASLELSRCYDEQREVQPWAS